MITDADVKTLITSTRPANEVLFLQVNAISAELEKIGALYRMDEKKPDAANTPEDTLMDIFYHFDEIRSRVNDIKDRYQTAESALQSIEKEIDCLLKKNSSGIRPMKFTNSSTGYDAPKMNRKKLVTEERAREISMETLTRKKDLEEFVRETVRRLVHTDPEIRNLLGGETSNAAE